MQRERSVWETFQRRMARLDARMEAWSKRLEEADNRNREIHLYGKEVKHRDRWNSETFHEYLFAVNRDKNYLMPQADYPDQIELGREWHAVFNQMRQETQDGYERISVQGVMQNSRQVVLGKVDVGKKHFVPGDLIFRLRKNLIHDGADNTLSDVHTHPRKLWRSEFLSIPDDTDGRYSQRTASFSAGDLYCLAELRIPHFFMGLIDGHWNYLAFRSRETLSTNLHYLRGGSQEDFARHWYRMVGFDYTPHDYDKDQSGKLKPFAVDANIRRLTPLVASRHNLVVYAGRPNRDLEWYY